MEYSVVAVDFICVENSVGSIWFKVLLKKAARTNHTLLAEFSNCTCQSTNGAHCNCMPFQTLESFTAEERHSKTRFQGQECKEKLGHTHGRYEQLSHRNWVRSCWTNFIETIPNESSGYEGTCGGQVLMISDNGPPIILEEFAAFMQASIFTELPSNRLAKRSQDVLEDQSRK